MMDVGIDVGGTNLRAGVVDEQGKLLSRVSQPMGTLKSPEELIRQSWLKRQWKMPGRRKTRFSL